MMELELGELIDRWRGRRAVLTIELARTTAEGEHRTFRYEGILDGPYVGDCLGIGFMLGSEVISGDIAILGPYISVEPSAGRDHAPILNGGLAMLDVVNLPLLAVVEGDTATWTAHLAARGVAKCRLRTAQQPRPSDPTP